MGIVKKRLRIGGMSCINCQNKIERKLKNTAGVREVSVSYNTGTAEIIYDSDIITSKDVKAVIERLGYEVLSEKRNGGEELERTVTLLAAILLLYVVFQRFGILNILVPSQLADTKMGYGMLFVVGLLTSVHCIAMCGGINLSQCIPSGEKEGGSGIAAFYPAFLYNLGRVISYTVIGFLLGLVGMLLGGGSGAGLPALFQGILKMIAGIFMVIMGVNMLGIFPWLRRFTPRMPRALAARIGRKKAGSRRPLVVGLLNGLMPCGPLQSMQIVALALGNPFAGALAMFLFSLGTVPLMLGLGSLVLALGKKFSQKVMCVGAVLVVVLGLAMLSQGGSLSGLLLPNQLFALVLVCSVIGVICSVPFEKRWHRAAGVASALVAMVGMGSVCGNMGISAGQKEAKAAAETMEIVDGVQVVNSTLTAGRYPNITVQAGTPVKWVIDVPSGAVNGCNYKMLLREYGIEHEFTTGENVIEFTPAKPGTVQYTCWMGMIRGNIFVTDKDGGEGTEAGISAEKPADVPVPSGYQIPTDRLAIAQSEKDANGRDIQKVSIDLTEDGFSPAVIVVEEGTQVVWNINNQLEDAQKGTVLLAPVYSTKLGLMAGENTLYLSPQESFEMSTEDHRFYVYVKVIGEGEKVDEEAIRKEVSEFEPLIYPDSVFVSQGAGCCG